MSETGVYLAPEDDASQTPEPSAPARADTAPVRPAAPPAGTSGHASDSGAQGASTVPDGKSVPYDRFKEVNSKAKQAERERDELRAALEARDEATMSEAQKLARRLERAEQRAAEMERRAISLERGGWIRSQAARAGFLDPDDALAFVDLGEISDERDAERAVKKLADTKKHLVKPADDGPRTIGRVIENGERTSPRADPASREATLRQQEADAIMSAIRQARAAGQ